MSTVQRWEYVIVIGASNGSIFVDNESVERPGGLPELLNELGAEGWELVGQSEAIGEKGGEITFTLRRPRR